VISKQCDDSGHRIVFHAMAESNSVVKGLVYGAIASMVGDMVTMPVDVTKTRMQVQCTISYLD